MDWAKLLICVIVFGPVPVIAVIFLFVWLAGEWCNPNCIWVALGLPLTAVLLLAVMIWWLPLRPNHRSSDNE